MNNDAKIIELVESVISRWLDGYMTSDKAMREIEFTLTIKEAKSDPEKGFES